MKKLILTALFLCVAVFIFTAQAQTTKPTETKKPTYDELVAKLKGGDTKIDYKALRMAFVETKNYSWGGTEKEELAKFMKPLNEKNYKETLKLAEKFLEKNYVEINAHYTAYQASKELKDETKAAFYKTVLVGLLDSIKDGKDGLTAETAFFPITIDEEYILLRFLGYKVEGQALQSKDGHQFDVMSVVNPQTNEKAKFYFNIDVIWANENKMFSK